MLNKFILTIVLAILISAFAQQQQATSSWTSNASELKKWSQTIHLTTMQQILIGYPSLKQNMKIDNFVDLIEAGGCSNGLELARFAIVDKKVYFYINSQMPQFYKKERIINFYKFLDAVSHQYKIPDMYFAVYFQDEILPQKVYNGTYEACKQIPLFMYHKDVENELQKYKFLLPDPLITNVTWLQIVKKIKQISQNLDWENKDEKLYFRDIASHSQSFPTDKTVSEQDFYKYYHRGAFVLLSLKNPDAIDAKFTKGTSWLSQATQKRAGANQQVFGQQASLEQQLKYRYILAADGSGASWKKIPIALFSNSILFKPQSSKVQWFYNQLIPGTHFIQVKQDLSDLLQKQQKMNENITKAKQIIEKSNQFAQKNLTYRSIISHTLKSLKKYAQYQNLNLTKSQKQRILQGKDIHEVIIWRRKRLHFIVFQTFLLLSILVIGFIIKKQRKQFRDKEKEKLKQTQSEISIKEEVYTKQ